MSSRRVLVTGATGFVGVPFVAEARKRGWEVIALLLPGEDSAPLGEESNGLYVVRGTMADIDVWAGEVEQFQPDVCLHLAWQTAPGIYLDTPDNLQWLSWSGQLFARVPSWGVQQIVGVGTCAEYDAAHGFLRESTPLLPLTLYAACKIALRLVGQQLASKAGIRFAWARLFHIYGPREHPQRLVASCIRTLLAGHRFEATEGRQVRDFLHICDVAAGLASVIESGAEGDVNICSGVPTEVRQVLGTVAQAVGRPDLLALGSRPQNAWDPPFLCGDSGRIRSYGWRPEFGFDTGIADAVAWWRSTI